MTRIIGLVGPAGSGKSTIAKHLVEKYGAKRYSLAGPLKEITRRAFDLTHEQVYGTQEQKETIDPRYGVSPRWIMQRLGTEGIRAVLGRDFWLEHCLCLIANDRPEIAVVDDVRFVNETTLFCKRGAVLVRLHPPPDELSLTRVQAAGKHASEEEWSRGVVDYEIAPMRRSIELLIETFENLVAKPMRLGELESL